MQDALLVIIVRILRGPSPGQTPPEEGRRLYTHTHSQGFELEPTYSLLALGGSEDRVSEAGWGGVDKWNVWLEWWGALECQSGVVGCREKWS